jgi:hypothetical protein
MTILAAKKNTTKSVCKTLYNSSGKTNAYSAIIQVSLTKIVETNLLKMEYPIFWSRELHMARPSLYFQNDLARTDHV